MNIQSAAHYMKLGYRIRRSTWDPNQYIDQENVGDVGDYSVDTITFSMDDLLADDWEIITKGVGDGFPVSYDDGEAK